MVEQKIQTGFPSEIDEYWIDVSRRTEVYDRSTFDGVDITLRSMDDDYDRFGDLRGMTLTNEAAMNLAAALVRMVHGDPS